MSELVVRESRLSPRVSRIPAMVCDDCGRVLLVDSIQPINEMLKLIEALEERVYALENVSHRMAA